LSLLERLGFQRAEGAEGVLLDCSNTTVACREPVPGLKLAHFMALHAATTESIPVWRAFCNTRLQSHEVVRTLATGDGEAIVQDIVWPIPARGDGAYEACAVVPSSPTERVRVSDGYAMALVETRLADKEEAHRQSVSVGTKRRTKCSCCSLVFPPR
jgi:hypothetical protein